MTLRRRLDAEMVRRGLASGRDQAKRLIEDGGVRVNGSEGAKAATLVGPGVPIVIVADSVEWASRGGLKLAAALDAFDVDPTGMKTLDVGASHGGFTDVLLARGATSVVAVDVGYGQLVWRLAQDPRVTVVDRTNFRTVDVAGLGGPFDLVVMDVSFISVAHLAANLAAAGRPGSRYVVLVKPQFEVGKQRVGRGGIVSDPRAHTDAISAVSSALASVGIGTTDLIPSPITGAKGNHEFLVLGVHGVYQALAPGRIEEAVQL
jgi:23S rRNA (cytidine1920-2'-O)/16S rRNA (cytidine1409-2'-O)-methyltransferase